tara:strand:- start:126 stop:338 length:213 start_codon:yes stop_codon:yes gene_type:complete
MKYNVTEVEFDFDEWHERNWDNKFTFDEEIAIRDLALGVYEANDENDLREEIIASSGFYPIKFDYEVQLK